MVYTCNWGILATGGIAKQFTKDLLIDPATRETTDVKHRVVAVASSTSVKKAQEFIEEVNCSADTTRCYGRYEDLVADKDVEIVYIATPHSHHYENAKLCLNAGKSVLCEKPFTINAEQTKHLTEIAAEKKLFLMEAVWTRFFPLSIELQRLLFEEKIIGRIRRVHSDFGMPFDLNDTSSRLIDPSLGGGTLLDLGLYNLTWLRITCFADPRNKSGEPEVKASMLRSKLTGVDEQTSITLNFPETRVQATMQCNMVLKSVQDVVVRIQGDEGDITVQWPPYRPNSFTVYKASGTASTPHPDSQATAVAPSGIKKTFDIPGDGHGMFWEADECARCIRDGKLESDRMPWSESIAVMSIMTQARQQNDFYYPDLLEQVTR